MKLFPASRKTFRRKLPSIIPKGNRGSWIWPGGGSEKCGKPAEHAVGRLICAGVAKGSVVVNGGSSMASSAFGFAARAVA